MQRATEIAARLEDPYATLLTTLLGAWMGYERGQWDRIGAVVESLGDFFPWAGRIRLAMSVNLAWRSGREREARTLLAAMPAEDLRHLERDENWLVVLAAYTLAVVGMGDVDRAAVLYELLEPYADRNAYNDLLGTNLGSVALYLGALAGTLTRFDDAFAHLDAARTANAKNGIRPGVVRADLFYAQVLRLRAEEGDVERADELAAEAAQTCRQLGLGIG